jgi:hypothetical protein
MKQQFKVSIPAPVEQKQETDKFFRQHRAAGKKLLLERSLSLV